MSVQVPMAVLAQELATAIEGRTVRTAVFTTYTFDPGFFELNILPTLFDQSFSQPDKLRRVQLEDALRSLEHCAVYYDRAALSQDADPAHLDYRRLDVNRRTGAFHPKLILLLVEEPLDADDDAHAVPLRSLVVGVLSANLTRAGWWENLECGHFAEIKDRDWGETRNSFRSDLLAILRRIRSDAGADEDHGGLDAIRGFLRQRASKKEYAYASSGGHFHTRLFGGLGEQGIADWLWSLNLTRHEWNLEIVSPYFSSSDAGPLGALLETLSPRQTRVMLPTDPDGTAQISAETYAAIADLGAKWSYLPKDVLTRGRSASGEALVARFVHAKLYRLWRKGGPDVVLAGSPNLTNAAHGHGGAGNLEAAFFLDATEAGWPGRWLLQTLEDDAEHFASEAPNENDGLDDVAIDVGFRFDWASARLEYRLGADTDSPLDVYDTGGVRLFAVSRPKCDGWIQCGKPASEQVGKYLEASSFLLVRHQGAEWRVLVREENMAYRPSLFAALTPEEILEYWSLLTPEQRAAFLEQHAGIGLELEGLSVAKRPGLGAGNTLFDRFAGLYHAFGCLRRHIDEAIPANREAEAEARLFGAKYDSLPVLLEKTLERDDTDPVMLYVTFLAAEQLRRQVKRTHPAFYRERRRRSGHLDALLGRLDGIRAGLPLAPERAAAFVDWYESAFLRDLASTAHANDND